MLTFATEQRGDSSYRGTEPVSIGPLYSVGVAVCVLPKSRVTDPTESASYHEQHHQMEILSQRCTVGWQRAKNTCLFPYLPLRSDKCMLHGT